MRPALSAPKRVSLETHNSYTFPLKIDPDLKSADKIIVVMGPTGVGKSRFIKEATGDDVQVGDSLFSGRCTQL